MKAIYLFADSSVGTSELHADCYNGLYVKALYDKLLSMPIVKHAVCFLKN